MPKKRLVIYLALALLISFLVPITIIFSKNSIFKSKTNGNYDIFKKTAVFHGNKYKVPEEITQPYLGYNDLSLGSDESAISENNILGSKSSKEKRIEVDLDSQKLYAYEGDKKKMSFDVSTGKWNLTPTGEFRIWSKLKYTLMTGGSKELGTYYYLPNVPFTMYFYKDYGIHGAYWHNNFGHPMSHGCINMKIEDSEKLFYWANPPLPSNTNSISASNDNLGTKVIIYGTTPRD